MGLMNNFRGWLTGRNQPHGEPTESQGMEKAITALVEAYTNVSQAIEDKWFDKVSGNREAIVKRTNETVHANLVRNYHRYITDGRMKRGVNLHTDFVFGNGIGMPKPKDPAIQQILEDVWYDPTNQRNLFSYVAQQKRHKELYLSGELNLVIKVDVTTGRIKLYTKQPKDILNITTDPEDENRHAFYAVRTVRKSVDVISGQEAKDAKEEIIVHRALRYKLINCTADQFKRGLILHIGLNELFGQTRGESDLASVRNFEDVALEMAEDGATLSKANAQISFVNDIKGGKAVRDKLVEAIRTKTDGSNPSAAVGSEWVQNEYVKRNWMETRNTGSMHREKDQRMIVLPVFAGFGFGEHYFGDASTGNLATATSMELPVLKMTEAEQQFCKTIFAEVFNFAIDIRVALGLLDGEVVDWDEFYVKTKANSGLTISFPPILRKDAPTYIDALQKAVDGGLLGEKEAAYLAGQALGVENVEEMVDELFPVASSDEPEKDGGQNESTTKGQDPQGAGAGATTPADNPEEPGKQPAPSNANQPAAEPKAEAVAGNHNGNGRKGKYSEVRFLA